MVVFYIRVLACLTGYAAWVLLLAVTIYSLWLNKYDTKEVKTNVSSKASRSTNSRR